MSAREEKLRAVASGRRRGIRLVLEDIHDPHNAGAILRTADAFGIQEVWFVFVQEKVYNPRRVGRGSSSSANKWLSFRTFTTTSACFDALEADAYTSFATTPRASEDVHNLSFATLPRVALWVGNEHRGLSEEALARASMRIHFPMRGMVESLNVSVATALFIEAVMQGRIHAGTDERLEPAEIEALAQEFLAR